MTRKNLISSISEFYGDLNMLHPFREGNGRVQRLLFEKIIINAEFEISWVPITPTEWLQANIASVNCNYLLFQSIFERCIGKPL